MCFLKLKLFNSALSIKYVKSILFYQEKIENLMKENNSLKAQMVEIRGLADEALSPKDTSERSRGKTLMM